MIKLDLTEERKEKLSNQFKKELEQKNIHIIPSPEKKVYMWCVFLTLDER